MTTSDGYLLTAGGAVVERLLLHFGLEDANTLSPQVQEFLRQGKKINAIKAYREETGMGLKEAKDAVERLSR